MGFGEVDLFIQAPTSPPVLIGADDGNRTRAIWVEARVATTTTHPHGEHTGDRTRIVGVTVPHNDHYTICPLSDIIIILFWYISVLESEEGIEPP